MNSGIFGFLALLVAIGALAYLGYVRTQRLPLILRAGCTVVPVLSVTGTGLIFLALAICNVGDVFTVAERARCDTTTLLSGPVALGYFVVVAVSWVAALRARDTPTMQRRWLIVSCGVALVPNVTAVLLVAGAFILNG